MSICDLCQLSSPSGCTRLSNENCLKAALKLIKASATNGDVIKALFPNVKSKHGLVFVNFSLDKVVGSTVTKEWWSTPYKAGDTDAL